MLYGLEKSLTEDLLFCFVFLETTGKQSISTFSTKFAGKLCSSPN